MVDLPAREVPEVGRLFEFILIEDHVFSVGRDPEIKEEVCDRFKRTRVRRFPLHRLEDVDVVSHPSSVRTVDSADIERSILKEEPDPPVADVQNYFSGVSHGF